MQSKDQRLSILTAGEVDEIYGMPNFSDEDRNHYFSFSATENSALQKFKTEKTKALFMLQLGYFKARNQFFDIDANRTTDDQAYIIERYFPAAVLPEQISGDRNTKYKQQKVILSLLGFSQCGDKCRQQLDETASQAAAISGKPIYVFRQLMHFLTTHKHVFPAYKSLQDIVGKALSNEQGRMASVIQNNLTVADANILNRLLRSDSRIHVITELKRDPRDFTLKEIKQEIERGSQIKELYELASRILPMLEISNESIKHYASLMEYYTAYRLKNLDRNTVHLYCLCFAQYRYQRHFDNLLASFIFHARKFNDAAKNTAKEKVYLHRLENNRNLRKAAQILRIFVDGDIDPNAPFQEVQKQVFAILKREQLESITDYIGSKVGIDESLYRWQHIDKKAYNLNATYDR